MSQYCCGTIFRTPLALGETNGISGPVIHQLMQVISEGSFSLLGVGSHGGGHCCLCQGDKMVLGMTWTICDAGLTQSWKTTDVSKIVARLKQTTVTAQSVTGPVAQLLRLGMDGEDLNFVTDELLANCAASAATSEASAAADGKLCSVQQSKAWRLWERPGDPETRGTVKILSNSSAVAIRKCSSLSVPECIGLGWPLLRLDLWLLRRRRPPAIATAGEKTEGGGGFPMRVNRDSISSFWRVCRAWISIICLKAGN